MITKGIAQGPGGASTEAGFAVPIQTVNGLVNGGGNQALCGGAALQMPAIELDC
jgi:hypothetical protein